MAARAVSVKSRPKTRRVAGVFKQVEAESIIVVTKAEKPMGLTGAPKMRTAVACH